MEKIDVCPSCGHENCNSTHKCKKCGAVSCIHCCPCHCNTGFEPVEAVHKDCDLHEPKDSEQKSS